MSNTFVSDLEFLSAISLSLTFSKECTTNEYLAIRDAEEMGQVYEFLGLTIGVPCVEGSNEMEASD